MTKNITAEARQYWGFLIAQDKSPTPRFEQLLLGIAHYISKHVVPWDVRALTPTKLATFYRLVGGNYDSLFLEAPVGSLSFIYKSLGCFHSLQQDKDPFSAPSIPALTPAGFVRWQTVQLLLNPEEHVPYLQEALKRFELVNPGHGGPFPKVLPADCLPRNPDVEMTKWHERVGERLRIESEATTPRSAPPTSRPSNSRPTELESVTDSSSIVDVADYFQGAPIPRRPSYYPTGVPFPSPNERRSNPQSPRSLRRRSSAQEPRSPDYADGPTPTYTHPYAHRSARRPRPVSVESASSSSSSSRSPRRTSRHARSQPRIRTFEVEDRSPRSYSVARSPYAPEGPVSPLKDELGRRHSSHVLASYDRRDSGAPPPPPGPPPQPVNGGSRASQTLSPPFFASQNGRLSNQVSPTGPTVPPSMTSPPGATPQSAPLPQGQFARGIPRNSVSHGSGPIDSWRSKLNAYVNGSGSNLNPNVRGENGRRRSQNNDPIIEGVRFVEGVGGDEDNGSRRRRRRDYEREWESEREERRRDREERRRSSGVEGAMSDGR